jgi:hypothetical protein
MKLFLAALTIWSLPLAAMSCGAASVQQPAPPSTSETVTLTNQNPTGSFPLQPDLIKNVPAPNSVPPTFSGLQVTVTKVANPNTRAVTVFVYLSRPNEKRDKPAEKIEVGSFSLYPVDRPGKFTLNAGPALRKAANASNDANIKNWKLMFELDQKTEQASSPLEVTIAAPIWTLTKG